MEKIEIKQKKQPFGFGKPTETSLQGAVFQNGKIAYLKDDDIRVSYDEKCLVDDLKQESGCIEVRITRTHKV